MNPDELKAWLETQISSLKEQRELAEEQGQVLHVCSLLNQEIAFTRVIRHIIEGQIESYQT